MGGSISVNFLAMDSLRISAVRDRSFSGEFKRTRISRMDDLLKLPGDEEFSSHVAHVMRQISSGDPAAAGNLLPLVYDQLRALAQQRMMQERPGHTLQATALVHEAFLKLVGPREIPWTGQAHFYAAAAEAMRRILIDHARTRHREKRGGKGARVLLNVLDFANSENSEQILALDEALCRLEQQEPEVGEIVRLRFFAGLSVDQVAELLGVSPRTIDRRWKFARVWLFRELQSDGSTTRPGNEEERPDS
jgi:RNA polymerase sigma factor (TIGR02999 family)